ncbi:DUF58 domain-containing protein [bacterium]|nr:DUF58 domain-containing protein [bacterium]
MALSFIGLGLFLFLVATNTQSGWVFIIVAALAATLLLSYTLSRSMVRGLTVARQFSANTPAGQDAQVTIAITNTSKHAKFGITIIEHLPDTLPDIAPIRRFYASHIPAHCTASFTYTLPCKLRGYHHFTDIELESAFPLSVFFIHRSLRTSDWLCVAPQTISANADILGAEANSDALTLQRHGNSDSIYGLHEYTYGEDLRYVHWPASAHSGKLLIKDFQDECSYKQLIIAIDPTRLEPLLDPRQEDLENAISLAATLTAWCAQEHISLVLATIRDGCIVTGDIGSSGDFFASIQAEPPGADSDALFAWLENNYAHSDCRIILFSIPGTAKCPHLPKSLDSATLSQVICLPGAQTPTLYLDFSRQQGKRLRHYLSINSKKVPADKRQIAENWQQSVTEASRKTGCIYVDGQSNTELILNSILMSLR